MSAVCPAWPAASKFVSRRPAKNKEIFKKLILLFINTSASNVNFTCLQKPRKGFCHEVVWLLAHTWSWGLFVRFTVTTDEEKCYLSLVICSCLFFSTFFVQTCFFFEICISEGLYVLFSNFLQALVSFSLIIPRLF